MSNRSAIEYDIRLKTNQNDLQPLLKQLQSFRNDLKLDDFGIKIDNKQLYRFKNTVEEVERALTRAFNPKLNTVNIQRFNKELTGMGFNVQSLHDYFSQAGVRGESAFKNISTQMVTTNREIRESHKLLDKMAESLGNTIRWQITSGLVNAFTRNVQQAYGYVKALDNSLNDIRIVTGRSSDEMASFAREANKAAKELGTTTVAFTDASLTFFQQGLNEEDAKKMAEVATKIQNVTGLRAEEAAEYVTSVINGYRLTAEEAEGAMDKLAAVAATTASDLAELSQGMSKVASSANALGVSEDQLAATLSTVVSVTRLDPSSIGTALTC